MTLDTAAVFRGKSVRKEDAVTLNSNVNIRIRNTQNKIADKTADGKDFYSQVISGFSEMP